MHSVKIDVKKRVCYRMDVICMVCIVHFVSLKTKGRGGVLKESLQHHLGPEELAA